MIVQHPTEVSGPPLAGVPAPHLLARLWARAEAEPDRPLAAVRDGEALRTVSTGAFVADVRRLAAGLLALGVEPGDRVALWSRSRLEWIALDHAILAVGAVTVPLYDTASPEQVTTILADAAVVLAVVEDGEKAGVVAGASLPACREVVLVDAGDGDRRDLDGLRDAGREVTDAAVDARVAALGPDDVAALLFSSGTTGQPHGCVLTHGSIAANVRQTVEQVPELVGGDDPSTLLFLPLAHAFSRIQVFVALDQGVLLGIATGLAQVAEELPLFRPTFILATPRVLEKVYAGARRRAADQGREGFFDRAAAVAVAAAREAETGRRSLRTRLLHPVADRLVLRRVRAALGGRCRQLVVGGAALGADLSRFFTGTGITVLEGYGLTEASPIVSGGPVSAARAGTVGRPFPATTVRIAADGEVLVRGPQVFRGYWDDEEGTARSLRDGWLATGDLGAIEDGRLRITGRKKEILVTASGKNVVPGPLEERVGAHPLVSACVVVGEGRPFVGALVAVDVEEVTRWARDRGRGADLAGLADDGELRASIDEAVAAANAAVSRAEQIRAWRLLVADLTVEGGELTPTLKVRRHVVLERHAHEVEALYR